jgi:serine/threonine-protein kinase
MLRAIIKYLAIVAIFCTVAGLSAFFTLSFFIESEDKVIVPDLTGKNAIEALETLSDLNLNTKVAAMEHSKNVARHHVIKQNPPAGETIKVNRDVSLIISKGARLVTVPDLSGLDRHRAEIVLEKKGLNTGHITRTHNNDTPPEKIITQYPKPESFAEQGDRINLLVSAGPEKKAFLMPDIRGRFLEEAIISIENHAMVLEGFKSVHDPSRPQNTVTGQAPPAGYRVEKGEEVRLIINRPPKSRKPDNDEKQVLFSHRLSSGFLKQRVKLEINTFGTHLVLIDGLMDPGELIWAIVPEHTQAAVFLYINGKLIESKVYN